MNTIAENSQASVSSVWNIEDENENEQDSKAA